MFEKTKYNISDFRSLEFSKKKKKKKKIVIDLFFFISIF
jgi:hypothetical protein